MHELPEGESIRSPRACAITEGIEIYDFAEVSQFGGDLGLARCLWYESIHKALTIARK
ncbi:MAG: hypothetical protein U1G07_14085 [Verrucomicrobiota bacterium]